MVERMLDLVCSELETDVHFVDKTFLEPSAGDGNFLIAILRRKLNAIERRYPSEQWLQESLHALASIYGVELLEDNHQEATEHMLAEFLAFQRAHDIPCGPDTDVHRAAAFIIATNVVRGNTLTAQTFEGKHIVFSWWERIAGASGMVQRKPFALESLRPYRLELTVYPIYQPSTIDRVHEEAKSHA
jgi:hypothetical protein